MFVQFEAGRDGNPIAFIHRKVSFPPRGSNVQIGEWWEVEIEHETERVNFLRLTDNFSAKTEIIGRVKSEKIIDAAGDPYSYASICPDSYKLTQDGSFLDYKDLKVFHNQVWKFMIDHQHQLLFFNERFLTVEEEIVEKLKSLLSDEFPTSTLTLTFNNAFHCIDIRSSKSPSHNLCSIEMSDISLDTTEEYFSNHVALWNEMERPFLVPGHFGTALPRETSGRTFGDGGWLEDHSGIHG